MMKCSGNVTYLALLYFLQGWPYGFQARFLPVYFRSRGMSLSSIGFFKLLLVPWMCKALWAPLVDRLASKQTWLLCSMVGLSLLCCVGSVISPTETSHLALVMFLFNLLTATQDIAVDGIAIQILSNKELAGGNMAQVVGYKVGALAGGGLTSWLSDYLAWSHLFLGLALMYFTAVFVIIWFQHLLQMQNVCITTCIEVHPRISSECLRKGHKHGRNFKHVQMKRQTSSGPHNTNTNYSTTDSSEENLALLSLVENASLQNFSLPSSSSSTNSFSTVEEANFEEESNAFEDETFFLIYVVHQVKGMVLKLMHTEGTGWIILFVLLYKLGEQGAFNMVPLFLLDQGMPLAELGFWLNTTGQAASILGSVLGGTSTTYLMHPKKLLHCVFLTRTMLLLVLCSLICAWSVLQSTLGHIAIFAVVCLMFLLLALSGLVTTMTFTLMMRCSQRAPEVVQATHYTVLATFEVMGKLTFASLLGMLTEWTGYSLAFALFTMLAAVVIPLLELAPDIVWARGEETAKNQ